jgi:uncharacterized protein (DUF2267 family)
MKYDEFISQVQRRADLASREEAERATRATMETLGERLAGGEAKDLGVLSWPLTFVLYYG